MPNTVIALKKSATPSSVPSDLANGELAINFADGKLFYKNTAGFIAEFSGAVNSFGTVNANGTLVVSDTSGDVLSIIPGTGIAITGDAINDTITISATGASTNVGPAFDKANAALANTTGTFEGTLTVKNDLIVNGNTNIDSGTLYVDVVNNRVGIGTTTPTSNLHVIGKKSGDGDGDIARFENSPVSGGFSTITLRHNVAGGNDLSSYWGNDGSKAWIGTTGNFPFTVFTNFTEKLRVTSTGNVGIGTTTPTSNLHVIGTANITGDTVISGNVGIGTTSPTSRLHVSTTSDNQFRIDGRVSGSIQAYQTSSNYMNFSVADGGGRSITITSQPNELAAGEQNTAYLAAIASGVGSGVTLNTRFNGDGNHISLRARGDIVGFTSFNSTSATERFRVTANGNVGIGINNPSAKIHSYVQTLTNGDVNRAGYFQTFGGPYTGTSYGIQTYADQVYGNSYGIYSESRQDNTGGLGISHGGFFRTTSGGTGTLGQTYGVKIENAANSGIVAYGLQVSTVNGASTVIPFQIQHNSSELIRVSSSGNVGIGTNNPTSNLHVIGTANITLNLVVRGADVFSTMSGANTAIGAGANAYAVTIGTASNTYLLTTLAGANTAVGTGANAFASATIAGANTAVGAGANAFATAAAAGANAYMISVQNGSNTAVGAGANNYANATFVKLIAGSQTITGDLAIAGNLTLSGNTTFANTESLRITDPLIYLAGNNYSSDIVDIGFIGNYVNSTGQNVHTGLYREHADKMYYLFQGYDAEPINNHIGALSNNMTLAVLNADLRTSNLSLGGANLLLTLAGSNTAVGTGANTVGSAAFAKANAALANTTGTFNGTLTVANDFRARNANYTFTLPNVLATASWIKLGTFTASQDGRHVFIKVVTSHGYNAMPTQQGEVYIHFKTSNGVSVDANGFAGEATFYITNSTTNYDVKVVSNAAGVSATSFDIYFYQSGSYNGAGSFYTVELGDQYNCTWTNSSTTSADPGSASSSIAVGTQRFIVQSNVGIGTTTPTSKLHVVGAANITSSLTVAGSVGIGTNSPAEKLHVNSGAAEFAIQWDSTGSNSWVLGSATNRAYIRNKTNSTEVLTILNGGNVGIGTSSPGYKFVVADNTNSPLVAQFINSNTGVSTAITQQFLVGPNRYVNQNINYNSQYYQIIGSGITSSYTDFDTQWFRNNAGTVRMVINGAGDVGIGTSSPSSKFTVSSNTQYKGITLNNGSVNSVEILGTNASNNDGGLIQALNGGVVTARISGTSDFATYFNTSTNFGIGTSSPTNAKLHIQRSSGETVGGEIYATEGSYWYQLNSRAQVGNYSPLVQSGDHTLIYSNGTSNTGALVIGQWSSFSRGIRIDASGNVGIGRSDSSYKLDVVGTINASNILINGTPISTGGGASVAISDSAPSSPTANSLWWSSDLGKLFIYYNDGSSNQWVETSPSPDTTQIYATANAALSTAIDANTRAQSIVSGYDTANAAFAAANSAASTGKAIAMAIVFG